jgi:hypothetical protein
MKTAIVTLFLALSSSFAFASTSNGPVCVNGEGTPVEAFIACGIESNCGDRPAAERAACIREICGAQFDALPTDCQECIRTAGTEQPPEGIDPATYVLQRCVISAQ